MKKDREGQVFAAAILLIVMLVSAIPLSWKWHDFSLKRQAKPMIEALERYRQQHGAYPEDSDAAGFPIKDESGPLFYQRNSPSNYIIWYGTSLGESVTFDSTRGNWND